MPIRGISRKLAGIESTRIVTAISTGYVLSAAGEAIAFIPNEIGASLLHNERVTQRDRVTP